MPLSGGTFFVWSARSLWSPWSTLERLERDVATCLCLAAPFVWSARSLRSPWSTLERLERDVACARLGLQLQLRCQNRRRMSGHAPVLGSASVLSTACALAASMRFSAFDSRNRRQGSERSRPFRAITTQLVRSARHCVSQ
jgi:hypothetical protein